MELVLILFAVMVVWMLVIISKLNRVSCEAIKQITETNRQLWIVSLSTTDKDMKGGLKASTLLSRMKREEFGEWLQEETIKEKPLPKEGAVSSDIRL